MVVKICVYSKKIWILSYVQGLNDKEIARILGVSQQNISKHRLKALTKLRINRFTI
ncbi:sigma factor-like helix-turn-helix DNA-binding protein [Paenibacillus amylolyticus]|uniref:RNA polymerase sigma factor n=1 Tax=Paenibacillus TaxID=44249 RepID=UPI0013752154